MCGFLGPSVSFPHSRAHSKQQAALARPRHLYMKGYACEEALDSSFRWKVVSGMVWNSLLLYVLCYFLPYLQARTADFPAFPDFVKSALLLCLLLLVKVWTFTSTGHTDFPDCCSALEEVKKLFTATSFFHAVIVVYLALFPLAYRSFGVLLGVLRPLESDNWVTVLGAALGAVSGFAYLLNHEYVHIWSPVLVPRSLHLLRSLPSAALTVTAPQAAIRSAGVTFLVLLAWTFQRKQDLHSSVFSSYESNSRLCYDFFIVGFCVQLADLLFLSMMHNFLTKPPKLDLENALGEQLAVVGLKQMSPVNVQFVCFQDLLRVSTQSGPRFLSIFNPKAGQWSILLDRGLDSLRNVTSKIRNRTSAKVEHEGPRQSHSRNLLDRVSFALYSVFNEDFECKFRRELYQVTALAEVASAALTNFLLRSVAMECEHFVHRDNSIGKVLEAQWQSFSEVRRYQGEDLQIDLLWYLLTLKDNLGRLYGKFRETHPGVSREVEEQLAELVSG